MPGQRVHIGPPPGRVYVVPDIAIISCAGWVLVDCALVCADCCQAPARYWPLIRVSAPDGALAGLMFNLILENRGQGRQHGHDLVAHRLARGRGYQGIGGRDLGMRGWGEGLASRACPLRASRCAFRRLHRLSARSRGAAGEQNGQEQTTKAQRPKPPMAMMVAHTSSPLAERPRPTAPTKQGAGFATPCRPLPAPGQRRA